jgi:glycerophosphoryl diester phosphodiesterase
MLRIGHRGAAGSAPENTIVSMKRALSIGVDAVEFDVHRTLDNQLVVIHDPTIDRTTTGQGIVGQLTLAEIRQFDAGQIMGSAFAGERVPTLAELVAAVPAPTQLFLELKCGSYMYPGIEQDLAQFIKKHGISDRVQISSFDHHALRLLRDLLPDVPTGMLYYARPIDAVAMARACGATALHPMWLYLTPEDLLLAHAAGLQVNVWTPNLEAEIAHCQALKVDGIITNYPERL